MAALPITLTASITILPDHVILILRQALDGNEYL